MTLLETIKSLSSGTIGSITGLKKYDAIDKVINDFYDFSKKLDSSTTWQDAWKLYRQHILGLDNVKKYSDKRVQSLYRKTCKEFIVCNINDAERKSLLQDKFEILLNEILSRKVPV